MSPDTSMAHPTGRALEILTLRVVRGRDIDRGLTLMRCMSLGLHAHSPVVTVLTTQSSPFARKGLLIICQNLSDNLGSRRLHLRIRWRHHECSGRRIRRHRATRSWSRRVSPNDDVSRVSIVPVGRRAAIVLK
jgi:hypothetical protein